MKVKDENKIEEKVAKVLSNFFHETLMPYLEGKFKENDEDHEQIFRKLDRNQEEHDRIFEKLDGIEEKLVGHEKRIKKLEVVSAIS